MDSTNSTPVVSRKRKSTQNSIQSTPTESKRRKSSGVEIDKVTDASAQETPISVRSVGRKRKASADAVSDSASVEGSVDGEQSSSRLRSGKKRGTLSDNSLPAILPAVEEEEVAVKPIRKSTSRKKLQSTENLPETTNSSSDARLSLNTPAEEVVSLPPTRRQSAPLLALPPTAPTPAPKSAAKPRKSLSAAGIAATTPATTPGAQSIVSDLSPQPMHARPTPNTPAVVSENTTVQVTAATEFPADRATPQNTAAVYSTMHVEEAFSLAESNNWYSWLSALLLILLTMGSLYRQVTMPADAFRLTKSVLPTHAETNHEANQASPFVPNVIVNASNTAALPMVNFSTLLPNQTYVESLEMEILHEKHLTQELFQKMAEVSLDLELLSTIQQTQRSLNEFARGIDEQLRQIEDTLLTVEANPELLAIETISTDDLPSSVPADHTSDIFSGDIYAIKEDPAPIVSRVVGSVTHEYVHSTDGLTVEQYQRDTHRQIEALQQTLLEDIEQTMDSKARLLQDQLQTEHASAETEAAKIQEVSHAVESFVSELTGENISLLRPADQSATSLQTAEILGGALPSIEGFIADVEEAVEKTNQKVAQHAEKVGKEVETALKATIAQMVATAIDADKSKILQHVVQDASKAVQDQINRLPKSDFVVEEEAEEEDELENDNGNVDDITEEFSSSVYEEKLALLVSADDIASSTTGARVVALESSNYCMKSRGDPLTCAASYLRVVNSYAPIQHANDCYAFEKLEKNDAITITFFQPSTVFGFGLSHFLSNTPAQDDYTVGCAPKEIYFTTYQLVDKNLHHDDTDQNKRHQGKLPRGLKAKNKFISLDTQNFTFTPLAENLNRKHLNEHGTIVSQLFPLDLPMINVSKMTLHIRSTQNSEDMACVYRLQAFGKLSE